MHSFTCLLSSILFSINVSIMSPLAFVLVEPGQMLLRSTATCIDKLLLTIHSSGLASSLFRSTTVLAKHCHTVLLWRSKLALSANICSQSGAGPVLRLLGFSAGTSKPALLILNYSNTAPVLRLLSTHIVLHSPRCTNRSWHCHRQRGTQWPCGNSRLSII